MKKLVPEDAILIPTQAKRVFKGVIYDVYQWEQPMFDGASVTFEMLRRPDTVFAICIVDERIVVLHDEQPHRGTKLTFPGGRVDPTDGSPLEAVQREVKEETGYSFAHWQLVDVAQPLFKLEWFVHAFVAWGVTAKDAAEPGHGEKITPELKTLADMKALVSSSRDGDWGDSRFIFDQVENLEDLQRLPGFKGQAVDQ